jgi:HD-GYP domain-containing protein (c-di-GMP phosphodiesterase class II)
MVCIRVKDGPSKGAVYSVQDEVITIGRDNDAHIQIMDQGVSRRHAEIFRVGEMYFLRDLGSRNGTYVNEERISEELLREGDRIRIGQTTLTFEDKAPAEEYLVGQIEFSHMQADPGATMEFRFGVMDFADIEDPDDAAVQQVAESHEPKHLLLLYQVSRAVSSERDAKQMLQKVIALSSDAVGADHGYIFVHSKSKTKRELNLEASYEKAGSAAPAVSTTIIKRVIKYGRATLTTDASTDERFGTKSSVIIHGVKSVICAPLVAREKTNGVIYLSAANPNTTFSKEDVELISAIGIQTGMALNSIRITSEQRMIFTSIISTLVSAVEMRDPRLKGSSKRVSRFAKAVAQALNLPHEENNSVALAALLHNIGRLSISEADIILSQSAQTREATLEYKQAVRSEELLGNIEGLREILPAVKHSFEKFDGSGYPDGLAGDQIPLHARIIAGARAFDELLGDGPRDKLAMKEALFDLNALAQEGEIDPETVKAMAIAFRTGFLEVGK